MWLPVTVGDLAGRALTIFCPDCLGADLDIYLPRRTRIVLVSRSAMVSSSGLVMRDGLDR